jgi:steroid 5-alpha reductase family enzyme
LIAMAPKSDRTQALFTLIAATAVTQVVAVPAQLSWLAFLSLAINIAAFIPSYYGSTEKYYDFVGMLTYLALISSGQIFNGAGIYAANWRQLLASSLVVAWTLRLGLFLFSRTCASGGRDSRFDKVRSRFWLFLTFWLVQSVWAYLTSLAVLMLQRAPVVPAFALTDAVGLALFVLGWGLELVADYQKAAWKRQKGSQQRDFIDTGLWSWSRQ